MVNVSEYGDSNYNQTPVYSFTTDNETNCASGETDSIGFSDTEFLFFIVFAVFTLFFVIGYQHPKRSAGFFLMLSGFILVYISLIIAVYMDAFLASFISIIAILIVIMGIRKVFFHIEEKPKG